MRGLAMAATILVATPALARRPPPDISEALAPVAQCGLWVKESNARPKDLEVANVCRARCTKLGFKEKGKPCLDRWLRLKRARTRWLDDRCQEAIKQSELKPSKATYDTCARQCKGVDDKAASQCARRGPAVQPCKDKHRRFQASEGKQSPALECRQVCRGVLPALFDVCERRYEAHLRCDRAIEAVQVDRDQAACEEHCQPVARQFHCVPPRSPCERVSMRARANRNETALQAQCVAVCGPVQASAMCPREPTDLDPVPVPVPPKPSIAPRYVGYGGVAVGAIGGAIWLWGEWDEEQATSGELNGDEVVRLLSSGETKRGVGQAVLGVGVAIAVGGLVWWLFDRASNEG